MKYTKKPTTIEAIQWNGSNVDEINDFTEHRGEITFPTVDGEIKCCIRTLEGDMYASINDYIIKGVDGEFYPCKPGIFKKTYTEGFEDFTVTDEMVEKAIKKETYTILPSGKTTVCELILENGFSVVGISSCVDIANFNKELGEKIARENAVNKVWELEGYRVQNALYSIKYL